MAEIYGETQRMVPLQKVLPRQARDGGGLCEETGDGWLSGVELVKEKKKKKTPGGGVEARLLETRFSRKLVKSVID